MIKTNKVSFEIAEEYIVKERTEEYPAWRLNVGKNSSFAALDVIAIKHVSTYLLGMSQSLRPYFCIVIANVRAGHFAIVKRGRRNTLTDNSIKPRINSFSYICR